MNISVLNLDALIRAASDDLLEDDVNYAKSLDTSNAHLSPFIFLTGTFISDIVIEGTKSDPTMTYGNG